MSKKLVVCETCTIETRQMNADDDLSIGSWAPGNNSDCDGGLTNENCLLCIVWKL